MGVTSGLESSTQAWPSVFNIGNCAIGAGILSFPYAVQRSGYLGGSAICLIVAAVELYTLGVLMRQSTKHRAITYQGLVLSVLGKRAAEAMAWTIFLFLFGSCVAFLIITGDTFGMVLRHFVIEPYNLPAWLAARQIMILLPALTIMLPLSLQRSMGSLATASTVAVYIMMFTTVVLAYKAVAAAVRGTDDEGAAFLAHTEAFRFDAHTFSALPVIIFAYHCHVQAVPIYFELVSNPSLLRCGAPRKARRSDDDAAAGGSATVEEAAPSNGAAAAGNRSFPELPASFMVGGGDIVARKLKGMYAVLATAYLECTVLYLLTGLAGYFLFPRTAASNILNSFATGDMLMQAMRFCVGWAVVMHYPINQAVARSALYDLICQYINIEAKQEDVPYPHVAAVTVLFFVATATTACVVTDLGIVFQLIGGLAGSLLIFILPGGLIVADRRLAARQRAARRSDGSNGTGAYAALDGHDAGPGVRDMARPSLEGWRTSANLHEHPFDHDAHLGTAAEHSPDGAALDAQPCHECAWDQAWVGWLLVLLGSAVAVLTMYTSLKQYLRPSAGEDALLHAGMSLNSTLAGTA